MSRLMGVAMNQDNVSTEAYFGMFAQQYAGTRSAGIVSLSSLGLTRYADKGLVTNVFSPKTINQLVGNLAIGHNSSIEGSIQPYIIDTVWGQLAICADASVELLARFTEALERSEGDFEDVLHRLGCEFFGPYALLILGMGKICALRGDGRKPLCFGKVNKNGYAVASQENAIANIGGVGIRHFEPGELIVFDAQSAISIPLFDVRRCIHEIIFNQSPECHFGSTSVYEIRRRIGRALGKQFLQGGFSAKLIYSVPLGGNPYAAGVAEVLSVTKTKYNPQGVIKNLYPRPEDMPLDKCITLCVPGEVDGQKVLLVNDILQSGEEVKYIARLCLKAGAKEVHVATASLLLSVCQHGAERPMGMIGPNKSWAQIADELEVSSFITLEPRSIRKVMCAHINTFCVECLEVVGCPC
ncbi:MAG: hypothetical protein NT135_02390 [Candidatus Berkelbacteria bacterium]|nr:hypothetical protein [Candidatus Berkelbacteria bacterium]